MSDRKPVLFSNDACSEPGSIRERCVSVEFAATDDVTDSAVFVKQEL